MKRKFDNLTVAQLVTGDNVLWYSNNFLKTLEKFFFGTDFVVIFWPFGGSIIQTSEGVREKKRKLCTIKCTTYHII